MKLPCLVGRKGHFKEEVFPLQFGKTRTVGRSRSADISLRRCRIYRNQSQEQRDSDDSALTVSAIHFQITIFNMYNCEIKSLSPNGILIDGQKTETMMVKDLAKASHLISFGTEEEMALEMRDIEED